MLAPTDYAILAAFALLFVTVWAPVLYWSYQTTCEAESLHATIDQHLRVLTVLQAESIHAHRQLGAVQADLVGLRLDMTQQASMHTKALSGLRQELDQARLLRGPTE